ncbi:MAG: hypothetical protein Q6363_005770 [Candidatus Njordarchaeota archaeon]
MNEIDNILKETFDTFSEKIDKLKELADKIHKKKNELSSLLSKFRSISDELFNLPLQLRRRIMLYYIEQHEPISEIENKLKDIALSHAMSIHRYLTDEISSIPALINPAFFATRVYGSSTREEAEKEAEKLFERLKTVVSRDLKEYIKDTVLDPQKYGDIEDIFFRFKTGIGDGWILLHKGNIVWVDLYFGIDEFLKHALNLPFDEIRDIETILNQKIKTFISGLDI